MPARKNSERQRDTYIIRLYCTIHSIITSNGNLKYFFSSLMPSSDGARKERKKDFTILLPICIC